jgi:D-proline reductase (dithiol) PrdB
MTATSDGASGTLEQLRGGLWETINQRYPGSMIEKHEPIALAPLRRPLSESRLCFVSTAGVQPKGSLPFDTVHPLGDLSFRAVPSRSLVPELEIHQIKYITAGANRDLNVIFPIERLQELAAEGVIGGLTDHFFSFVGYNMDPVRVERELAEQIATAVAAEHADIVLLCPA